MRLEQRIERQLKVEIPALRLTLEVANDAVRKARRRGSTSTPAPARGAAAPPPNRLLYHVALEEAWSAFYPAVVRHTESEEASLAFALDVLAGAESLRAEVIGAFEHHLADHEALRKLASAVRVESNSVEDARRSVHAALTAMDEVSQSQEIEIFPAMMAGSDFRFRRGDTPVPAHYRTSDDVAAALRMARRSAPLPPEPEPEGLWSKIQSLWRR